MKLKKLLESSMRKIDIVEYYNDAMTFLYDFPVDEIHILTGGKLV